MAQYSDRLGTMQDLRESVMEIQRDQAPNIDAVARVKGIVNDANSLLAENRGQMEMLLDGQIFLTGQSVFRGAVQNLDTNLEPFSMDDYVTGISAYLESTSAREMDWRQLSEETFGLAKMSPRFDFKLGSLILEPPPKPEKVVKERPAKSVKTEKTVVKAAEETEATDKAGKENCEHILTSLARCYRKNKDNPINYFKFIIDPSDFWRTVHNVYHCAHLIKDNKLKMSMAGGQPMLEPIKKKESEQQAKRRNHNQFNFRLTPHEYRQLIETFHITEALIPPLT